MTTVSQLTYAGLLISVATLTLTTPVFFLYYLVILLHIIRPLKYSLGNFRKTLNVYGRLDHAFQRYKFWCRKFRIEVMLKVCLESSTLDGGLGKLCAHIFHRPHQIITKF